MTLLQHVRRNYLAYSVLAWVWVLYAYFSITNPSEEAMTRYSLSEMQNFVLRLSVMLPVMLIWFMNMYGIVSIHNYTQSITNGLDKQAWKRISWGLGIFLISSLYGSFLGIIQQRVVYVIGHISAVDQGLRLFSIYGSLILSLVAFVFLCRGSASLLKLIKKTPSIRARIIGVGTIVVAAALLSWLVFSNPYRTVSDNPDIRVLYGVNDALIILTILIPYTSVWLFGIMTLINFHAYGRFVKGTLYRLSLHKIIQGLSVVLGLSIVLQIISQFGEYWAKAGLWPILMLVYVLLALILVGYALIAIGARKLQEIEEVPLDS